MTEHTANTAATEPKIANPIFAIAAQAAALRASGVDVITLAAGEPETPTAAPVVAAAIAAAQDPVTHHYGSAAGMPALREAVATSMRATHHPGITAGDVLVTLGAKHALHLALHATTTPGDEVLVARPGWPGHTEVAVSVGATAVAVTTGPDFLLDVAALEAARTPRTRALILANPANPTGAVHPPELLAAITRWCHEHGIWLISDEVYDAFAYDAPAISALSAAPDARDRIVTVNAVSKVHAMTGWRVGWLAGPAEVLDPARDQIGRTITHVPLLNQAAALTAVHDQATPRAAVEAYRRGRNLLVERLNTIDGVDCAVPSGGMFAFPDVTGLLAGGRWADTAELAQWLLEEAHVAVVSGTAFDSADHLRINFTIDYDRLAEAADRLANALT
ncbi:pyridoxal phosphate-dependent aminotransferase [Kocuria turfanensis]|uniref:pyridoxal phosphate-dependent aminotransferase n=1 Tax=Kocuria turfanensis TaxID=388357 RepID=UPI0040353EE7